MNKKNSNPLDSICENVISIEEELFYGTISFQYDALMSAMKPGHPMEILDDILSEIFWDVKRGDTPELSKVENVLTKMIEFKDAFAVKELEPIIDNLEKYISDKKKAEESSTS